MNLFIDSHAHINDPAFDTDRQTLLSQTLPQAGVIHSVEIGCAPDEWQPALALCAPTGARRLGRSPGIRPPTNS